MFSLNTNYRECPRIIINNFCFAYSSMRQPLNNSGRVPQGAADKKSKIHPKGESFVNLTKTLMEGGLCLESITPAQYRGRLGGGGCLFGTFSAPE